MKKISKKILSVFFVVAIVLSATLIGIAATEIRAVSETAAIADGYYDTEYYSASGTQFISDLAIGARKFSSSSAGREDAAKRYLTAAGYTLLGKDLNDGINGYFIHMGYKTSTNESAAIRAIAFYNGATAPATVTYNINGHNCTFYPVTTSFVDNSTSSGSAFDLNAGVGGDWIYMYYTRDPNAGPPMTAIEYSNQSSVAGYTVCPWINTGGTGQKNQPADLNAGNNGEYIYICYSTLDTPGSDVSGEHVPTGYDFKEDRWSFSNINEKIDRQYFIDMYEEQKGQEIYEWMEKGKKHGHCFGMATSTAATLINAPYVTDYISWTSLPYTKLSSVNKGTMNIDMDISAKDYIKYCHIYQGSLSVLSQRNTSSHQGIKNVYNAVKNAALTNTDCTLIVIDLWGGPGGHTVYAAGIDGEDILVNDSNAPGSLKRIEVNGSSWKYSAAGLTWDSSVDATINYVDDVITPYMNLVWNVPVEGKAVNSSSETNINYSEDDEINGTNSYYSNYIEPIDTDKLLVVSERDSFSFDESENMYEVVFTDGAVTENSNALYWIANGDTVNAENKSNESATLKLVGNEMKITTEMPVDSNAELTVNENGDNKATFDVKEDDKFSITFTTLDDSKQFVETTLTGTANGNEVTAAETEAGIQVTGLNDITVTYETADGTAETKAEVKDGSTVNITVNDDENKVETDWQDKQPDSDETDSPCKHPDTDHNGICDNCGKDFTADCGHSCHSDNAFVQFFYKIARFFWKLFGMQNKRFCACGKAHW